MERLREQYPQALFIGIGDSHTDLPFLRLCHYAMLPRVGQIHL
jgi:phosphoserine phosphatase